MIKAAVGSLPEVHVHVYIVRAWHGTYLFTCVRVKHSSGPCYVCPIGPYDTAIEATVIGIAAPSSFASLSTLKLANEYRQQL